jgi:hypothetical protein
MNKLFTFGDSFTFNKSYQEDEYSISYRKLNDFHWTEVVASNLNLQLVNFGYGSLSNDRIIDSILENHHLIGKNDIVIIGKTFYHRFDIPNNKYKNINMPLYKKFTTITPMAYDLLIQLGFSEEESKSIIYFLDLVNDQSFIDRTNFRYNFIEKFLYSKKISKCIFWEVTDLWTSFEDIKTATNNEINDNHWSFKGHRDFANHLLNNVINNKKLI